MGKPKARSRRLFLLMGHCGRGCPSSSHERCHRTGGGQAANPDKEWQWCPCSCHLAKDEAGEPDLYDCQCGGVIALAPLMGEDEDGDPIYVHVDPRDGNRMIGLECRE